MSKVNISELKPGMILASPVMTSSGSILLKEGAAVAEKHIGIFKKWGVWEADVLGADDADTAAGELVNLTEEERVLLEKKISERFPYAGKDPVMQEIMRIVKKIMMKRA